ncbi:MAG: HesA/MoeB/ThiF family protein, partial [Eubacteriales bacterium]|nr:HesA/MoeB/ThiF family protein [Eubacteriales bacterium]
MNYNNNERYSRQTVIEEIGTKGQEKLKRSSVLIIGCGGLGSPAALYLASAGIGRIGLVDDDIVSISNLQRQILHGETDLGVPKTESAENSIKRINSDIIIDKYQERLTEDNAEEIFREYDFIIDATDNFESKFLINDVCVRMKKAFVHAGVMGFKGQVMTYVPGKGPCYRCIFCDIPND